ncbi:MAG: M20/M25/M40 family metallo-hydrolase [Candidatus Bathyarchaeia archaeon]
MTWAYVWLRLSGFKQTVHASADRAFADAKKLSSTTSRIAGTVGDKQAIEFIVRTFKRAGLEVRCDKFRALSFQERSTTLEAVFPVKWKMKARAMLYTCSTSPRGVEGELAYVGQGKRSSYRRVDVRGKIVLIERPVDKDSYWDEASLASKGGARAVVVIDVNPWIFTGTMETGFFDSARRFRAIKPRNIPVVGIARDDGHRLLQAMKNGSVVARLKVDVFSNTVVTQNVRGFLKGRGKSSRKILITAHRDSANTPGANDNGSGTAVLLELARVLGKYRVERSVELVSLGAEEVYGQLGSQHYCKAHASELPQIDGLINVDMIGVGSEIKIITQGSWPDRPRIRTDKRLNKLLHDAARALGYRFGYGVCTIGTSDEGRFLKAGVPSAWLWKPDDPCYHSIEDTYDRINPNDLKAVADVVGTAVLQVANNKW